MFDLREGQKIRDFLNRSDVNASLEAGKLTRLNEIVRDWTRLESRLFDASRAYFRWNDQVARKEAQLVMPIGPASRGVISRLLPERFPDVMGPLSIKLGGLWKGTATTDRSDYLYGFWGINKETGELERVSKRAAVPTEGEAWEYIDTISEDYPPEDLDVRVAAMLASIKDGKLTVRGAVTGPVNEVAIGWRKAPQDNPDLEPCRMVRVPLSDGMASDTIPAIIGHRYEVAVVPVVHGGPISTAAGTQVIDVYGVTPEVRLELRIEMLQRMHQAALMRILRKGYTRKGAKLLHNIDAVRRVIRDRLGVNLEKLWLDRHTTVQRGVAWSTVNPPVESYMTTLLDRPGGDAHPDLSRIRSEIHRLGERWKTGDLHAGVVIASETWMPNLDLTGSARI